MREHDLFIGGRWVTATRYDVCSPFDGRVVARVARAGETELRAALDAAAAAREAMASLPPHRRAEIVELAARLVGELREELASVLVEEAGKPIRLARIEAERCAETLADAARVAREPAAELLDLGGFPSGEGRLGLLRRFPVGVVLGIAPFNFPLNLVAHKLAPAIAAGCPIVLKPASQTPSPALLLAEVLHQAGLPEGAANVVACRGQDAAALLRDPRVKLLTFTGSAEVGWELKRQLWDRKVALELGGNAAVIVEPDCGELAAVASRIAAGAYAYAGQSCISVQRVLVHESILAPSRDALIAAATSLSAGDPAAEEVWCGPLITPADAERVASMIAEAEHRGARLLTPRRRQDSVVWPAVLERVPHDAPLWAEEAFGPVASLAPYRTFDDALAVVNESRFGLQAGVFTSDLAKVQRAFERLEVGGVIQGDASAWRSDPMPYGGVKHSGIGREGARFAVEEMTEPRLLVLRR
ncbi:MAG: aldehyde dehydrogenase family protein [Acidobacteriota bacterium]